MTPRDVSVSRATSTGNKISQVLLEDIRNLIDKSRDEAATYVNAVLTMLYWEIGTRIRKEILKETRAEYGKEIVHALSRQLVEEYGKGFSRTNIFHMIRFAEVFPDRKIVSSLSRELSWTHFRQIIYQDDSLKREFYAEMCRIERWSTRTLQKKIDGMLYERTALSRKPEETIQQDLAALREKDRITPDLVFRDPYILDFLGLKDSYSEKDLESAILRELESFILEIGSGFAFVSRQKRMRVDNRDYRLDLLFYHRKLRRLVAIELKLDEFKPEHKGQMELYLRWLELFENEKGERSPIGLILCAGKSEKHIELLRLGKSGIRIAEYFTELPTRKLLERKLNQAILMARGKLERTLRETTDLD